MKSNKLNTIKKVLLLTHRLQKGHIATILIQRFLNATQPFVTAIMSAKILDQLLAHQSFEAIMKNAIILIIYGCALPLIYWGLSHIISVNSATLNEKIDQMICEKTFTLDYDILENHETLDKIKKAREGANAYGNISSFCSQLGGIFEMIATIIYSIIILIPLFITSSDAPAGLIPGLLNKWYSFVILLAALVLQIFVSTITNKKSTKVQQDFFNGTMRINREYDCYFNMVYDYPSGKYIRLYKSQNMIMEQVHKTADWMEREYHSLIRKMNKAQFPGFITQLIMQITCYGFIGLKAIFGFISAGSALKYVMSYGQLAESLNMFSYSLINLQVQGEYLSHFYDFMEIKNKQYEGTIPTEKRNDNEYEIEFRDVSFRYANTENYVLKHVNQKIKIGTKTAIVGPNGAGKTTFIKLLCRLYEPTEGQILLNGVDIRYYDYKDYARLFSVVFQDFNLFSSSIAQNVACSSEYDEKKVIDCCNRAGFGDRLAKLKDGIKSNIYCYWEDHGIEISGGEAQKIAIARALYKDSPWVILDEPTSALDPVSEYEIYKHFDDMVQDKTSIYISHRMSSCRFCDNILVFQDGKITESGNHEKLLAEGGLYSRMWEAQAQYYN